MCYTHRKTDFMVVLNIAWYSKSGRQESIYNNESFRKSALQIAFNRLTFTIHLALIEVISKLFHRYSHTTCHRDTITEHKKYKKDINSI